MAKTTELQVMTSNALRAVLGELAPVFERLSLDGFLGGARSLRWKAHVAEVPRQSWSGQSLSAGDLANDRHEPAVASSYFPGGRLVV